MATPDEEFMSRLRATFKVEAEEHLQAISSTLLELEKSPSPLLQSTAIEGVYREAHSLKGAARAVDFSGLEAICQTIEGVFASWKRGLTSPSPDSLDALHSALDMIHALLESPDPQPKPNESRSRDDLIRRLSQLERPSPISNRQHVAPRQIPDPIETIVDSSFRLSARAADSCAWASSEQVQDSQAKIAEVAHSAGTPQNRP